MSSRPWFLLCLLLALFSYTSAQDCTGPSSCVSCVATQGCGWCENTEECLPGDIQGPGGNPANCTDWQFEICLPEECQSLSGLGCDHCNRDPFCGWCESTQSCVFGDHNGPIIFQEPNPTGQQNSNCSSSDYFFTTCPNLPEVTATNNPQKPNIPYLEATRRPRPSQSALPRFPTTAGFPPGTNPITIINPATPPRPLKPPKPPKPFRTPRSPRQKAAKLPQFPVVPNQAPAPRVLPILAVNQAKIKKLIKKNGKKKEVQKKKEHHNQENENNNKKEKEHHNKDNEHHNKATEHHNKKKEHHEGNAPPPRHAFVSSGAFSMAPQAWTWGVAALFAVFIPFMSSFLF